MIPKQGDSIAGRYRVLREIGRGGMGVVLEARDDQLERSVAIKLISGDALDEAGRRRFHREAQIAGKLDTPHTVRVYDVGVLGDGSPYLVMELLHGEDVDALRRARQRLSVPLAVDYVLQASLGLAAVHAAGIIHRDLKPANLFLHKPTSGPSLVKVLDFGIAKPSDVALDAQLTRARQPIGTPHYMAPEQIRADGVFRESTDIWALGVILYELTVGSPPFSGLGYQLQTEILHATPVPPTERVAAFPQGLSDVILRCLAKDPARRYQNLAGLSRALVPYGPANALQLADQIRDALSLSPEDVVAAAAPEQQGNSGGDATKDSTEPTAMAAAPPPGEKLRPIWAAGLGVLLLLVCVLLSRDPKVLQLTVACAAVLILFGALGSTAWYRRKRGNKNGKEQLELGGAVVFVALATGLIVFNGVVPSKPDSVTASTPSAGGGGGAAADTAVTTVQELQAQPPSATGGASSGTGGASSGTVTLEPATAGAGGTGGGPHGHKAPVPRPAAAALMTLRLDFKGSSRCVLPKAKVKLVQADASESSTDVSNCEGKFPIESRNVQRPASVEIVSKTCKGSVAVHDGQPVTLVVERRLPACTETTGQQCQCMMNNPCDEQCK